MPDLTYHKQRSRSELVTFVMGLPWPWPINFTYKRPQIFTYYRVAFRSQQQQLNCIVTLFVFIWFEIKVSANNNCRRLLLSPVVQTYCYTNEYNNKQTKNLTQNFYWQYMKCEFNWSWCKLMWIEWAMHNAICIEVKSIPWFRFTDHEFCENWLGLTKDIYIHIYVRLLDTNRKKNEVEMHAKFTFQLVCSYAFYIKNKIPFNDTISALIFI